MAVYYDADVSGQGSADLVGGSSVLYFSVELTALGPLVTVPNADETGHVLRAGWVSLGDHFDLGGGDVDWWREPIWIDFTRTLWTPLPTNDSGGPLTIVATRVRWSFSVDTTAHLHVFGT